MGKVKKNNENMNRTTKLKLNKLSRKTTLKPNKIVINEDIKKQIKTKQAKQNIQKMTKEKKKRIVNGPSSVDIAQFGKGVDVLLQYEDKNKTKDLFNREKPIFLQINAVKMANCPSRTIRIELEHCLLSDKHEVCLIVPDLKRGRNIDHEPTVEHYEDLLKSKNVMCIQRILPIRQLRVEYDQFELKRRLCGYYDHFLVAGSISGHVLHLLGKNFIDKRKIPVPIKLESKNLNEAIETALKKTTLKIHPKGASFIVQFGHTEMTFTQLLDNLKTVVNKLVLEFPGGWFNIQSLYVRTDKSIAIPIYYTLKNPNAVNVPVIKPIRPKKFEKVTDELTTLISSKPSVTVHPGGKVEYEIKHVRKIKQGKIKKQKAKFEARKQNLKAKTQKVKLRVQKEMIKKQLKQENKEKPTKTQKNNETKVKHENRKPRKQKISIKQSSVLA